MRRSVVVSAFFPSSASSEKAQIEAMECIAATAPSVDTLEFYFEGGFSPRISDTLRRLEMASIFLAAVKTKRDHLDLAATDPAERERALTEVKRCIDSAVAYGCEAVLINTGFAPTAASSASLGASSASLGALGASLGALGASLESLLTYADVTAKLRPIDIFMETGAMNREGRELIGGTRVAMELSAGIRHAHPNFFLTMDTSHLLQLGEEPLRSIADAAAFTRHVHLANCIIRDPQSPLYGDMHPVFGCDGGELSKAAAAAILSKLASVLPPPKLLVGVEIICRERDERAFFAAMARELDWFLKNGKGSGEAWA
ncbi:MAG: TIM barrel protein [Spirochaetia bacterium]|jgi:sugar phosphate isomerase/epimerase